MKFKSVQSVYFLNDLSLADELTLINQPIDTKPKLIKNKAFGKCIQISKDQLIKPRSLKYKDYFYAAENQNSVFLTMMLLSASPFINFLYNFKDKISDTRSYPIIESLINFIDNRDVVNIDKLISFEGCKDIREGYSFILRSIHQELVTNMHFEEDAWNIQKKGKAFKIYPEYSPIVEIFQGKIADDVGDLKSGSFEIVKDLGVIQSKNCKKMPYVFLLDCSAGIKDISLEGYSPVSILKTDSLIILEQEQAYVYRVQGFEIIEAKEKIFTDKKDMKYILYAMNK